MRMPLYPRFSKDPELRRNHEQNIKQIPIDPLNITDQYSSKLSLESKTKSEKLSQPRGTEGPMMTKSSVVSWVKSGTEKGHQGTTKEV